MTTNSDKSPCQKCVGHRNESRGVKNQLTPDVAPTKGVKLNSHRSALYLLTGVIKIASKSFMRSRNSIYTHFSKLGELNSFATMLYTVHLHAYTSFCSYDYKALS